MQDHVIDNVSVSQSDIIWFIIAIHYFHKAYYIQMYSSFLIIIIHWVDLYFVYISAALCGIYGYRQFFNTDWLNKMLSWQKLPRGCWGMTDDDVAQGMVICHWWILSVKWYNTQIISVTSLEKKKNTIMWSMYCHYDVFFWDFSICHLTILSMQCHMNLYNLSFVRSRKTVTRSFANLLKTSVIYLNNLLI